MKRLPSAFEDPDDAWTVAALVTLAFVWLWFQVNEPDPNYGKEVAEAVVRCKLGFKPDYWGICKEIKPDAWDQIAAQLAENMREMIPDYQIEAMETWEDVKEWWNDLF